MFSVGSAEGRVAEGISLAWRSGGAAATLKGRSGLLADAFSRLRRGEAGRPRRRRERSRQVDVSQAVLRACSSPVLVLGEGLHVRAASRGFCKLFDAPDAVGSSLADIFEPACCLAEILRLVNDAFDHCPGERILHATLPKRQVSLWATAERAIEDDGTPVVVLSLAEAQPAQVADPALATKLTETLTLLDEVQHRVANNLMIISAGLGIKARRTSNLEARTELESARSRVLAMAMIEQHLKPGEPQAQTNVGGYLEGLCRALSQSMISDDQPVVICVSASATVLPRTVLVRMGLIVAELVINALKHAFPRQREGCIEVGFSEDPEGDWRLTVRDDGVGLSTTADAAPGLGRGIISALAEQLAADVCSLSSPHGLQVTIAGNRGGHWQT